MYRAVCCLFAQYRVFSGHDGCVSKFAPKTRFYESINNFFLQFADRGDDITLRNFRAAGCRQMQSMIIFCCWCRCVTI